MGRTPLRRDAKSIKKIENEAVKALRALPRARVIRINQA
jgi:hypothetical protein